MSMAIDRSREGQLREIPRTARRAAGTRHRPDASGARRRITKEPQSARKKEIRDDHDPRGPCSARKNGARFDVQGSVRSPSARNPEASSTRATAAERDALHPKSIAARDELDALATKNERSPSTTRSASSLGERQCDPLGGGRVLALSFIRT
jgi:hypothetical protein